MFPNGVSYALRGRDSSYFGFIPTFRLILGWFYAMFCGLNWEDTVAGGKGLFRDVFESKWFVLKLLRTSLARNCVALHPFKPQTLDNHIFFVQTSLCTFLDSMERSLILESDHLMVDGILFSHLY